MMAIPVLKIKKNNDYSKSVTVRYSNGTAYDLTGKAIHFAVKASDDILPDDSAALILKQITSFDDAVNGQFTLTINQNDTSEMEVKNYNFDFRIINISTGKAVNTIIGIFSLQSIVTIE